MAINKRTKAGYKSSSSDIPLDVLIASLQKLGFSVTPPTTEEEQEKQQASVEKLGFKAAKANRFKKEVEPEAEKNLVCHLGIAHTRNGKVYGPGEVVLPRNKASLFNDLLAQDQLARQAYMDTKEYNNRARCFMLKVGQGQDRYNKFTKQEVSESAFNGDVSTHEPSVVTGPMDMAGYNPSFVQHHTPF